MSRTRHGHYIPGTVVAPGEYNARVLVARCGGPGLCSQCSRDAHLIMNVAPSEPIPDEDPPTEMGDIHRSHNIQSVGDLGHEKCSRCNHCVCVENDLELICSSGW